ncbi:ABC transporter ATP-binding protein [Rhodobacter capsulatus]|uniref:ABC transporter ATP-binding protein n=1 Tax=Rhodobacter capsulatus TaxID=1061 RepID=UPI0040268495
MKLMRFIWSYLPPMRGQYLVSILLAGLEGFLAAVPPLAVGLGLMRLAEGPASVAEIAPHAAACLLAVLLRIRVIQRAWKLGYGAGNHAAEAVRNRIVTHMRRVPLGALAGRWAPAQLATLIAEDGRWLNETSTFYLNRFLNALIATALLLAAALWLAPAAGLAIVLALGGGVAALFVAGPILTRFLRARNEMIGEATLRIGEYADGIAVFRAFGRTGTAQAQFRAAVDALHDTTLAMAPKLVPLQQAGAAMIAFAAPLAILFVAASARTGQAPDPAAVIPALFLTLAAATTFYTGVLKIVLPLELGERARVNIGAFLAVPELGGTRHDFRPDLDIDFQAVRFRHAPDKPDAVRDISFAARQGRVTAIVGPSGAGKSTLVALLLRFHDLSGGQIRLGGVDLSEADPAAVQALVSLVSQDVHLFRDTLRANLLLGDPGADPDRLARVIEAAQLRDLVAALPAGLDTVLGDTGRTLSGGERQRVAIARALLKDAPVIVLDEATSAMDPLSEAAIQRAIAALETDRTVIVIAHRLRTVTEADEIIVMAGGQIVARGRHDDLLAAGGLYGRLWAAQEKAAGWRLR